MSFLSNFGPGLYSKFFYKILMADFTHLHVHTQFSILDGASSVDVLIKKAAHLGMDALAITDHGNMFGVLPFVEESKKHSIKPVIGCELYVAEGSRFEKKGREDRSGFHLILLAKNFEGYKNLSRLCSLGYLEGFYYTPRVDKELLKKYSKGLIASSSCKGGEIPSIILEKGPESARAALEEYIDIFKDDFYLELQRHGLPDQETLNRHLTALAEEYNIRVIATNDCHFVDGADAKAHDILICLQTGKDLDDELRMKYTGQEYLKSPEEMAELFKDIPEAISNTREIVDKVEDYDITTKDIHLPVFPLPEGFSSEDAYLRHLTYEGAGKLYGEITPEIKERLDSELKVISDMGYPGYFIIVQDVINEARRQGVAVGPGRGSAAGSAVAYCTGITAIDPVKYNLIFERFLNPARISMPDIDIDFDDEERDKVLKYVTKKYGREKVAQIVTFGTMASRSAIRDVARVLKLPLPEADRLAKLVPEKQGTTLEKSFREVHELAKELNNSKNPLIKETLRYATVLEGVNRHTGVHACGVIIGPTNLIDCLPLSTSKDSELPVTQYEGKLVESVGMLKMDFLGLKTLSIIKDALKNIKTRHNKTIDIENVPLDDDETFKLYQRGDTIGTFQFESEGMRNYLKELKPTNIEDLIAMNALYRPGPMDFIPTYIKRKHGKEKVEYPHPWLEDILKPTYGIMVYQEQIMQAARIMAGYSMGAADILRRVMGKKEQKEMEEQKSVFIKGAVDKGVDRKSAEQIFHVMEKFAQYGFNRSHSAAYSVVAYRTAYLKAHYPAEFMAAVLTHNFRDIKKITYFMEECNRQNIPVLGPDVNESRFNFVVNDKGEIRFGLGAIKGVGESAVENIVNERLENGLYKSFFDFIKRVNLRAVNKKVLESLAMAGAFDCFKGVHRAQFFHQEDEGNYTFLDKAIKHAQQVKNREDHQQMNLFGDIEETEIPDPELPECSKWSSLELLKKEKEITGMYISGHPLDDYKVQMEHLCNCTVAELKNMSEIKGKDITFAGIVTSSAHRITKNNKPFGDFIIEDYTDSYRLYLFSEEYLKYKHYLNDYNFLFIKAKIQQRYNSDALEVRVKSINLLGEAVDKFVDQLILNVHVTDVDEKFIDTFKSISQANTGKCRLKILLKDPVEKYSVEMVSRKIKVDPVNFLKQLKKNYNVSFTLK